MRITSADRELAKELVEAFGLDPIHVGALGVIMSSHRQLPSDEKPTPTGSVDPRGILCGATIGSISCARPAHHPDSHGGYGPGGVETVWS